jgi:hypothetical protein
MEKLLAELGEEIGWLSGDDGRSNYRRRIRVERALFRACQEYCRVQLSYDIGGLTEPHRGRFKNAATSRAWQRNVLAPVMRIFNCHDLLLSLSPTDPSTRGNVPIELDIARLDLARRLATEALLFVDEARAILN